ncbi:MAG: hypothetical protein QXZ14_11095 [Candidatus Jordarchaeales archaeon]|nr:hypothetical protein [Candidatus Jordarchaeia archaeon]
MPRRKPASETLQSPADDGDWWLSFLKSRGYVSEAHAPPSAPMMTRETPALTSEQRIFAERLIYSLCPPNKGYAPVIVKKVREIYSVLEGAKDFAEWFAEVRQALNLKSYQLAKAIYDSLEGLRSPEAQQLREQWYSFLVAEMKGYGLI